MADKFTRLGQEMDTQVKKLGSYGCVNAETGIANKAEQQHADTFQQLKKAAGPGYMNKLVVRPSKRGGQ